MGTFRTRWELRCELDQSKRKLGAIQDDSGQERIELTVVLLYEIVRGAGGPRSLDYL